MKILQLVRCAIGNHQRDGRNTYFVDNSRHSRCTGCGAPMVKGAHGWRVDRSKRP